MRAAGYEPVVDTIRDLVAAAAGAVVVVGIAGPVCVGKTTTSDQLRASLEPISSEVVTTDGFLLPAAELDRRGLTMHKGFPESYDADALRRFLTAVREGATPVTVPVYSHEIYDILPEVHRQLGDVAVVLVEGVNALRFSNQLDLGVYIDAPETVIVAWYIERFLHLCAVAEPGTFYANFAGLDDDGRSAMAEQVWAAVNRVNFEVYIEPTRELAGIVVEKGPDHAVTRVRFHDQRS